MILERSKINRRFCRFLAVVLMAVFCLQVFGQTQRDAVKPAQISAIVDEANDLFDKKTDESYKAALPKYLEAGKLYAETGDKNGEGITLALAGKISDILGNKTDALQFYEKALALFREIFSKEWEAEILVSIGAIYDSLNDTEKAIENYAQALPIYKAAGDSAKHANTLISIGEIYESLNDKQKAVEYYVQALPLIKAAGDSETEFVMLNDIGTIYNFLGENRKALDYFNRVLPLAKTAKDSIAEATALNNIGAIYNLLGEKEKALEFYNKVLPIFKRLGDKENEAIVLNNIGLVYDSLGDKQKALKFFEQSLPIAKAVNDKDGQAKTLSNIGSVYNSLSENRTALEYYNQSLSLFRIAEDKTSEASLLNNIGSVYASLNENRKALESYNQALSIQKTIEDKSGQATTLNNIGLIYNALGERQKAIDYYKQSLALFKTIEDKSGQATALGNIGSVYDLLNEKEKAVDYFGQALSLKRAVGDKRGEAAIINNVGGVLISLGEKQEALRFYNEALSLNREIGHKSGEAATLSNIGLVYSKLGEKQKAIEYYVQALPLIKASENINGEAAALNNLMYDWESLKNTRLAVFYGKLAIGKYQQLRGSTLGVDSEAQKSLLRSVQDTYQKLAELLIAENQFEQAIQILSLYQDQQFFDFERDTNSPVRQANLSVREREFAERYDISSEKAGAKGVQIDKLKRQIGTRQPSEQEAAELKKLEAELKKSAEEFSAVLKNAEKDFSGKPDEKDKVPPIKEVAEMELALGELSAQTNQKTAAIYTLIGAEKFHISLVTSGGEVKHFESNIKNNDFNEKITAFYALLQSPVYDPRPLGKQLYDIIFKPIEAELEKQNVKILMWQLDGNLRYVPTAALFDGEKYLAEKYQSVVFTRTDNERFLKPVKPNWTGIGFGSSESHTVDLLDVKFEFNALPGVKEELASIFQIGINDKGIIKGEVVSDKQFTKEAFFKALQQKRPLVHISSHFAFRPGDDSRSFLLLGDGNALTLSEMKKQSNLFEGVELLTLSACNTAATQADASGREIDGFAELAQRLGASAVMATLWQVSDASTPWLMRDFYKTRESDQKMTKTQSLQKAQLALLNGTAETKQLPDAQKSGSAANVKIVVVPDAEKQSADKTRSDLIVLGESEAAKFEPDKKKPFAHPYYWSPFVIYGNWK